MGVFVMIRSVEWEKTSPELNDPVNNSFTSRPIYDGWNTNEARDFIEGYFDDYIKEGPYYEFDVGTMDHMIVDLQNSLGPDSDIPSDSIAAHEYKELLDAIMEYKAKHEDDWNSLYFIYSVS